MTEVLLTSGDAAKQLSVVPPTIQRAADLGLLPIFAKTLRGQRLFRQADVAAFGKRRARKEGIERQL